MWIGRRSTFYGTSIFRILVLSATVTAPVAITIFRIALLE